MFRVNLYYILLGVFLVVSCRKESLSEEEIMTDVQLNLTTQVQGQSINLDTYEQILDSFWINLDEWRFYLSDITFITQDGRGVKAEFSDYEENVLLYELGVDEQFTVGIPEGNYKELKFNVGLEPNLNDILPHTFPGNHPMSWEKDMYWDMLKYRFVVMEAFVKKDVESEDTQVLSYHLGGDDYVRTVSIPKSIEVDYASSSNEIDIQFDLKTMFEDIDIDDFFSFHSEGIQIETGLQMMDNIGRAFK